MFPQLIASLIGGYIYGKAVDVVGESVESVAGPTAGGLVEGALGMVNPFGSVGTTVKGIASSTAKNLVTDAFSNRWGKEAVNVVSTMAGNAAAGLVSGQSLGAVVGGAARTIGTEAAGTIATQTGLSPETFNMVKQIAGARSPAQFLKAASPLALNMFAKAAAAEGADVQPVQLAIEYLNAATTGIYTGFGGEEGAKKDASRMINSLVNQAFAGNINLSPVSGEEKSISDALSPPLSFGRIREGMTTLQDIMQENIDKMNEQTAIQEEEDKKAQEEKEKFNQQKQQRNMAAGDGAKSTMAGLQGGPKDMVGEFVYGNSAFRINPVKLPDRGSNKTYAAREKRAGQTGNAMMMGLGLPAKPNFTNDFIRREYMAGQTGSAFNMGAGLPSAPKISNKFVRKEYMAGQTGRAW